MPQLPPLDFHAHLAPDVPARDLEGLGAVVFAATRSVEEFSNTTGRRDQVTVWGVGCHPSLVGVQRGFDPKAFRQAIERTPFVAEVGLDGSSRVPLGVQSATFVEILRIVATSPRLVSMHSNQATGEVLDALEDAGSSVGSVLHWWLGTDEETSRAVGLGAYFSINYSMVRGSEAWRKIPLDRLLTETDHPAGDRFSKQPRQPGHVQPVESALAELYSITAMAVRHQIWRNFARLATEAGVVSMLPEVVRAMLRAAQRFGP
jgi:TatD DNase family protein